MICIYFIKCYLKFFIIFKIKFFLIFDLFKKN